jgi:hypothetical protein
MQDKCANYSAPRSPRCFGCARPMQLVRRTPRFGALRDVYTFECRACGVWHIEEADALEGRPIVERFWQLRVGFPSAGSRTSAISSVVTQSCRFVANLIIDHSIAHGGWGGVSARMYSGIPLPIASCFFLRAARESLRRLGGCRLIAGRGPSAAIGLDSTATPWRSLHDDIRILCGRGGGKRFSYFAAPNFAWCRTSETGAHHA